MSYEKLTAKQRRDRAEARSWGKSAINHVRLVLRLHEDAAAWDGIAGSCARAYGADDSAVAEAQARAAKGREQADVQLERACAMAARAWRCALASEDAEYALINN